MQSILPDTINRTDQAQYLQALQVRTNALQMELKLPGLSVAACLPDGSVLTSVAGYADVERDFRMRASHRFSAGSISKTFVAALVHKAINDGKLGLDRTVLSCSNHEHWTRKTQAAEYITVGMLLSHSAGLPDLPWLELYEHKAFRNVLVASTDYPAILEGLGYFELPTNHSPGKRQLYSDVHYIVLGGILELVLGEKLEFTIQRELLYPFQLNSTEPALSSVMSGLARTYSSRDGGNQSEVPSLKCGNNDDGVLQVNLYHAWAGGWYVTTPTDLARWGWLLFGGRLFNFDYLGRLAREPTVHDKTPGESESLDGEHICYGCYSNSSHLLGRRLYHDGTEIGTKSWMAYYPEHQISVAYQANMNIPRKAANDAMDRLALSVVGG